MGAKIDQWWIDRIYEEKSEAPSEGGTKILAKLRAISSGQSGPTKGGLIVAPSEEWLLRNPVPSIRTVEDYLVQWSEMTPEDRSSFKLFRWPQSMDERRVPWEATRDALELVMALNEMGYRRPAVGLVNRYWQTKQALPPDIEFMEVLHIANSLYRIDQAEDQGNAYFYIESVLAYKAYTPEGLALLWEAQEGTEQPSNKVEVTDSAGHLAEFEREYVNVNSESSGRISRRYQQVPFGGQISGRMESYAVRKRAMQHENDTIELPETEYGFWIHFNRSIKGMNRAMGVDEENEGWEKS